MNTCPMCGSFHIYKQGLLLNGLDDGIRSLKKLALLQLSEMILQVIMGSNTGNKVNDKCRKVLTPYLNEMHYYCEDCHAAFYGNVLVDKDKEMKA